MKTFKILTVVFIIVIAVVLIFGSCTRVYITTCDHKIDTVYVLPKTNNWYGGCGTIYFSDSISPFKYGNTSIIYSKPNITTLEYTPFEFKYFGK